MQAGIPSWLTAGVLCCGREPNLHSRAVVQLESDSDLDTARSRQMRNWVAATAVLVLLVAASAGIIPWRDAVGGAFRPPDFAQDIAAARILAGKGDPYAA